MSTTPPVRVKGGPALRHTWLDRLGESHPRIALADGDDDRVRRAAVELADLGLRPVLLSDVPAGHGVEHRSVRELSHGPAGDAVADAVRRRGRDEATVAACRRDPVHLATALTLLGETEATVAGSDRPTADVLRAGLQVLGLAPASPP